MPLDGSNFALTAQDLLDKALSSCDLKPISPAALRAHKAEQITINPPGWAYRHSRLVLLAQAAALLWSVVAFFVLCTVGSYSWGIGVGTTVFLFAFAPWVIPTRGPARWRERSCADLMEVHRDLRAPASRLAAKLPDVSFHLGELYQDRIRLDPYLVADYRGVKAILGIWDGERVIASALLTDSE